MKDILVDAELKCWEIGKNDVQEIAVKEMAGYLMCCLISAETGDDYVSLPSSSWPNTDSNQAKIREDGLIFRTMIEEIYDEKMSKER